jgi:iron complex outermembrane receptor protein
MLVMTFLALAAYGQYTISGVVVDPDGQPMPGANLFIRELDRGGVSAGNGTFQLGNVPEGSYTLRVTFMGCEPVTREVKVREDLDLGRIVLSVAAMMVEEVMVSATRAGEKTPVAFTTMEREEIVSRNFGQDIPYLIGMTPSLVTTSDAGHGIGYTSMRIRGTDANRINVTVNGIPLNDAESHSVYWVDLPDIATSVDNIQVQRGVGTSTNGASAFGASVNLLTRKLEKEPYAVYEGTLGSFKTFRNAISAGTGLLKEHFSVDMRLSQLHSDGYIDRSWTNLGSYYVSAGYFDAKTMVKFITFSGKEELYQAWNGVPSGLLESDRTFNPLGSYTDSAGNTVYYDHQVDHYKQDHYQLHISREFNEKLYANGALHYTRGAGYYEEYREDDALSAYSLEDVVVDGDTISESDLIRRKWLENNFYGAVMGLHYQDKRAGAILGGGWNRYEGDHFGTVIWARYPGGSEIRHRWYENRGTKTDWNGTLKATVQWGDQLTVFADLQLRGIDYRIDGIDDDRREITQHHHFLFFNPKAGLNLQIGQKQRATLFVARACREPNRSNFVDADPLGPVPVSESLVDYEAGYSYSGRALSFNANIYFMDYTDQLVLTGEINDVGSAVMTNVEDSYRAGIELSAGAMFTSWIRWDVNATFSSNKILHYRGTVDNWDYWNDPENEPYQVEENLGTTDLAFSPAVLLNSHLYISPLASLGLNLSSRYVGRQFIDNTSAVARSLDPYFVNDLRISYSFYPHFVSELSLQLQVLNLFNVEYESNAWIYRYYSEGSERFFDGYFPQAGIHLMAGIRVRF